MGGGGYEPHHVVRCWLLMLAHLTGLPTNRVHHEVDQWLAEPAPPADKDATAAALVVAESAGKLVLPYHELYP